MGYLFVFAIGVAVLLLILIVWIVYKNVAPNSNILLCIATDEEKNSLIKTVEAVKLYGSERGGRTDILITGTGTMSSTVKLLQRLSSAPKNFYSQILNIGFAGGGFNMVAGKSSEPEKWIPVSEIYDMTIPADARSPPIVLDTGKIDPTRMNPTRLETHTEFVDNPDELRNPRNIADMEGYALATVAKAFNIAFKCYKLVSDSGNPSDYDASTQTINHPVLRLDDPGNVVLSMDRHKVARVTRDDEQPD